MFMNDICDLWFLTSDVVLKTALPHNPRYQSLSVLPHLSLENSISGVTVLHLSSML